MSQPIFDAARFVEFDLEKGTISSTGSEKLALVPIEALAAIVPSEDLARAARKWGGLHGARLRALQAEAKESLGMESLAEHLGGTLATLGMGRIGVEIRGDALAFKAEGQAGGLASGAGALLEGFLAGYLSALGSREFEVIHLGASRGGEIFFAGNKAAAERVRWWIGEGIGPLAAIERLAEGIAS